jgi:hypothetical protein
VIGSVSLWGSVIEHARGWRAEFAYPDRLRLVCGVCLTLGEGSGIPSTVIEAQTPRHRHLELAPVCAQHLELAPAIARLLPDAGDVQAELLSRYAVDLLPVSSIASLFERAPVPGSSPYRFPGVIRPTVPKPRTNPVAALPPIASSMPAPTPDPSAPRHSRPARLLREAANLLVGMAFWGVVGWWGCSSMVVEVPVAPRVTPRPTRPAPVVDVPRKPSIPSAALQHLPPPPRVDFLCGIPHGGWVELAACWRPAATLIGFAQRPPSEEPCGPPVTASTRTARYSICWSAFEPVDLVRHPRAVHPFGPDAA